MSTTDTGDTGTGNAETADAGEREPWPCPFCGEVPEVTETITQMMTIIHRCDATGAAMKIERTTREHLLDAWNQRAES